MFKSLKDLIEKKTEKHPDFKIFKTQDDCDNCSGVLIKELNTDKLRVLNIKNNILTIICNNKIISNEVLLRKAVILKKINKEQKIRINDIKIA